MSWYKKITDKCRGNGEWSDCMTEVHTRRDTVRKIATEHCEKKLGHKLSPFNVMNMAQCLRCGQWVECQNIFAPTDMPDIGGAASINKCNKPLDGEHFHSRDKYPEAPPSKISL